METKSKELVDMKSTDKSHFEDDNLIKRRKWITTIVYFSYTSHVRQPIKNVDLHFFTNTHTHTHTHEKYSEKQPSSRSIRTEAR